MKHHNAWIKPTILLTLPAVIFLMLIITGHPSESLALLYFTLVCSMLSLISAVLMIIKSRNATTICTAISTIICNGIFILCFTLMFLMGAE